MENYAASTKVTAGRPSLDYQNDDHEGDKSSLEFLLHHSSDVRIAGLSRWVPNSNITSLRLEGDFLDNDVFLKRQGRAHPRRVDRKMSYELPLCNNNATRKLEFVLLEPHLRWIGFAFGTDSHSRLYCNYHQLLQNVTLDVNDVPLSSSDGYKGRDIGTTPWFNHWFRIPNDNQTRRTNYTISACRKKHSDAAFFLHGLVAILSPA